MFVLGVYSKKTSSTAGTGESFSRYAQKTYWFIRRRKDDEYEVQPLNDHALPSGIVTVISKGQFIKQFAPEPEYFERKTGPLLKRLQKKLDLGEKYFTKENFDQAEQEFLKAISLDDTNAKANLRLGSIYCRKGQHEHVRATIKRILSNDAAFREDERHLFNEFGIDLRKAKHYKESVAYYNKAIALNNKDEHLHFNIARAFFESGQLEACEEHLKKALDLNAAFNEAARFLQYIDQKTNGDRQNTPENQS
ncbi:tetratricopeptide repeat protein [Desulfovibrio inopinatus]|uniref:tetratricopeptide repeat protein n=1 Tax=Desulfovibrio inopinatus TaxID=102109 RepID=UPI00041933EA|nr:tetratricopeptide repeat protein [Desulfovibrio inopinatus]